MLGCLLPVLAMGQSPACAIGMVIRAGAVNDDAKILEFNPTNGLYKVQYLSGVYKGDFGWLPPRSLKTCTAPAIAAVPESWFQGIWQLHTGGGGAWAKNPTTGSWKVIGLNTAGAPPIRINGDGSYEWVINDKVTVRGTWRTAAVTERKYGYEKLGTVILLQRGEDGKDWLVSRQLVSTTDGQDQILIERVDLGLTYRGDRIGRSPR